MKFEQARELLQKHLDVVGDICDILNKHNVSAMEGERIMLLLAGISAGSIAENVKGLLPALLIGWCFGAMDEGD